MRKALLGVLLLAVLATCWAGALAKEDVGASNTAAADDAQTANDPHIIAKNRNQVQKVHYEQMKESDDWEQEIVQSDKEEDVKRGREEAIKRKQEVQNDYYEGVAKEKERDGEQELFEGSIERSKEQAAKKIEEEDSKAALDERRIESEDKKKTEVNQDQVDRQEELGKKAFQQQVARVEASSEIGEKSLQEQKSKYAEEEAHKGALAVQKKKVMEQKAKHDAADNAVQEKNKKKTEDAQKTLERKDLEARQKVATKDEQHAKRVAATHEQASKQEQQKKAVVEKAQKALALKEQQAKEKKQKQCVHFTVWSGGLPANVWQFQVRNSIWNQSKQGYRRGFNVMVATKRGKVVSMKSYDTYASRAYSDRMAAELRSVANGRVIMIACMDECSNSMTPALRSMFAQLGLNQANSVRFRQAYAAIVVKGKGQKWETFRGSYHTISASTSFGC